MMRMRHALYVAARIVGWAVLSLVGLAVTAIFAGYLATRTEWGHRKLLALVLPKIEESLDGKLRIGRFTGDLAHGLILEGIEVDDREGRPAVRAARLGVGYNLLPLIHNILYITDIDVKGLWVGARHIPGGALNLATLAKPSPPSPPSDHPLKVVIRHVKAEARVEYEPPPGGAGPLRSTARAGIDLDGMAYIEGPRIDVRIHQLGVATEAPLVAKLAVDGGAHIDGSVVLLKKVAAVLDAEGAELNHLVPEAELQGPFHVRIEGDGPLSDLAVLALLQPPQGTLQAKGKLAMGKTLQWSASVQARGIDPGAATHKAPHGTIELDADGAGDEHVGTLHLARLDVDAFDAHANAHGDFDLAGYGQAEASVQAKDLSRFASLGVPGLGGAIEAHANAHRSQAHLAIDAQGRGSHLRYQANRLASVKLQAHVVDFLGDAQLEAHGLRASGQRVDALHLTAHAARHAVALHLDAEASQKAALGLDLRGQPLWNGGRIAGLDAAIYRLYLSRGGETWQNRGAAHVRIDSAVTLERFVLASGPQQIAVNARYALDPKTLNAEVIARQLDLTKLGRLAGTAGQLPTTTIDAEVRAHGPVADLIADAKVTAVMSHVAELRRVDLGAEAHYQALRARGQVTVSSAKATVDGRFDVPLSVAGRAPLSLDLAVRNVPFGSLRAVLPAQIADLQGQLDAKVKANGTVDDPALDAEVHASSWRLGKVVVDGKEVSNDTMLKLSFARGALRLHQSTQLGAGAGKIDAAVQMPLDLREALREPSRAVAQIERTVPIDASLTAQHLDFSKLPFETMGMMRPLSTGIVDVALKMDGTLYDPSLHVTVQAKGVSKEAVIDHVDAQVAVELVHHLVRLSGQMDLRGQRLVDLSGGTSFDVGRVLDRQPWKKAPLQLDLRIPSYDLTRLRGMQPQLDLVAGKLGGTLQVKGSFVQQIATADLSIAELHLAETQFSKFHVTGDFDGQTLHAQVDAAQKSGGTLALSGTVPLDGKLPWTVGARIRQFDLAFLGGTLEALRSTRGHLDATVDLAGTRVKPTLEASVKVHDGAFQLRVDPHRYDKIQLDLGIHQGTLRLHQLAVASGDGTLKASGDATLAGFMPTRLDIKAETHRFALVLGTLAAWLDSDIDVHAEGTVDHLVGRVVVHKGMVRLPKIASERKLQAIGEPPRITFVDKQARREEAKEEASAAAGETAITLRIPGPFYVRSKEANAELKGALDLTIKGSEVSLNGSAETTTGWVDLLGQRYTIDHARVGFAGDPADPDLDVRITRQLSEATLIAEVHGTPTKPQLDLFSDPPIYDKSQLLGIILSGDPAGQRVSDRSLDQKVVGAVSGLILGELKDAIAPSLPIDLIHVDTGQDGYTGLAETRVEVGKYLTENLYVSYIHQFGQPMPNAITNSNEARVEYRFKRRYELDTSFGDAGAGGVDLYWTLRY